MPNVFGAFSRGGGKSGSRKAAGESPATAAEALDTATSSPAGSSATAVAAATGWGTRGSATSFKSGRASEAAGERAKPDQQDIDAAAGGERGSAAVDITATAEAAAGSEHADSSHTGTATAAAQDAVDTTKQWTEEERVDYIQRLGLVDSGQGGELMLEFLSDSLASTPLPSPWTTNRDKRGRLYFVNTATRESSWNHPCDSTFQELASVCNHCCSLASAAECNEYIHSVHGGWMQDAQDAMGKWYSANDESSGQAYYYHAETNETMWENPAEVILPAYRTKLKAIAKLVDTEYTRKFEALHKASEPEQQVQDSAAQMPAPTALTSMADRTRAAEQAEAEKARSTQPKPQTTKGKAAEPALPVVYASGSAEDRVAQEPSAAQVAGSMDAGSSPSGSSASSVSLNDAGVKPAAKKTELDRGGNNDSTKARAAVPLLKLGAAATPESALPRRTVVAQGVTDGKSGQESSQDKGKGAAAAAQEVVKRTKAEHAATEEALAQERELHKEALKQQERWEAEKSAILAEVRQAVEAQEAHSLEARRREELELEARCARSARRREDWHQQQESLRSEMRQMLEMQQEQTAKLQRREVQREEERAKLEQELQAAIAQQQRHSSEDAQSRADWEAQNQVLREEVTALRERQQSEANRIQQKADVTLKPFTVMDSANGAMTRQASDWSFTQDEHGVETWRFPGSAKLEPGGSRTEMETPLSPVTRPSTRSENTPSPVQDDQSYPAGEMQGEIVDITEQLAAQKIAQQHASQQHASQQELAQELRAAINLHIGMLQETHEVLAEARAHEEALESAASQDAPNEQFLEDIRQTLELQKSSPLQAVTVGQVDIHEQIEEALAARATAEADESAASHDLAERFHTALQEKQEEAVEANEAMAVALRSQVAEALAPLAEHIKDIECRQEDLSEVLAQQQQHKSKSGDADLAKSSAAADALARQEALQERLIQEVQESLELQNAALREARKKTEPAIRHEVEALARHDASSHKSFESEVQQALEEKQREVMETNKATAAALQQQVAEALAPLTRHVQDVERRQDDDVLRVQADEERFQSQLEAEFRQAREAQDRSFKMQWRMESAVQSQVAQALEQFKVQVKDAERARTDDVDRMRKAELTRRLVDEEREAQRREDKAMRFQLQEAEIQERERRRESDRLAQELQQAHESELQQREDDLKKEMEWKVEKRSMQFRDEHREMIWKSEVRQLEWQVDWQAVQRLEDSELMRPSSAQSTRRTRSQSRVRENLFNALAASRENLAFAGHDFRDAPELYPDSGRGSQPSRPRSAKDLHTAADVVHGHSHRSSRPSSSSSRRSKRPTSAAQSDRSLAAEVAADLVIGDSSLSRAARSPSGGASSRRRRRHSQEATSRKQHSTRWHDLQQARQSDQQLLKAGGRSGAHGPIALTLDDIYRAYPEVSQIISLG